MRCEQFALCSYEAIGTVDHPVLGDVPTCFRCAKKLGLLDALVRYPALPCPVCKVPGCLGEYLDELQADRAVGWLLRLRELQAEGHGFDEALAIANREAEAVDA